MSSSPTATGEVKARSPSALAACRQSFGHRRPACFARRRNYSNAPGSSTPRAVPHARGKRRITAVPQIGWHCSGAIWRFVLPDDTIVPTGFDGPRPVLQTASLHVQHGLDVHGSVEQWIEQIARPMAGNSNVQLCVGTMFAGPLLKFAHEPPGLFHLWGTSKIVTEEHS